MKKNEPLERKDFTSYEAYQAYVLACAEASIKRTNEIIEQTSKIIAETNRILINKVRKITWNGYREMNTIQRIDLAMDVNLN